MKETIADIAYYAGYNKYTTGDSRCDVNLFISWAKQFEQLHRPTNWDEEDYILEVEKWAEQKIKEEMSSRLFA